MSALLDPHLTGTDITLVVALATFLVLVFPPLERAITRRRNR